MSLKSSSKRRTAAALSLFAVTAAGSAGLLSSASAFAADNVANTDSQSRVAAENGYWTPERILGAKPLDLNAPVDLDRARMLNRQVKPAVPSERGEGSPPSIELDHPFDDRLAPELAPSESRPQSQARPNATSGENAYFTTYRVFPEAAVTSYPNRAAGKLFFSDPKTGGNFVCSASVLRPRIIVTAGHCTANASTTSSGRYFYHDFLFVPAYDNGAAPYKEWTPKQEWVTNTWYTSNGSVPNAQDVGMLIANDQTISGTVTKIGSLTGYLGYVTNALSDNNVTMLGYPCNLDSCTQMELTNAQTFGSGGSNTYIYGSAMKGGASGGPWIQDYGVSPAGTPAPSSKLGLNYLVAVTSYQPLPTTSPLEYLGASNLDSTFTTLLSNACKAESGNC